MSEQLTIEQLAAASGMTVRNIREHQTRGLLPPPALHGRKGSYDQRHVARLRLIRQLQNAGLNLQAIRWLLERSPSATAEEVVRFERALFAPWGNEQPVEYSTSQLTGRLGDVGPDVVARAEQVEIIRSVGPARWEVTSPRLLDAGADLVDLGVPLSAALDVVEQLREQTDAIARVFVKLFVTHVWEPFDQQGRPAEQWDNIRLALERLRSIATQATVAVFHQSMTATIGRATAGVETDTTGRATA